MTPTLNNASAARATAVHPERRSLNTLVVHAVNYKAMRQGAGKVQYLDKYKSENGDRKDE